MLQSKIEQFAKTFLNNIFTLKSNIYVEFLLKYPGICIDYTTNPKLSYRLCAKPHKVLAPCLTEKLPILAPGTHDEFDFDHWLPSNLSYIAGEVWYPFGQCKTIYLPCPDGMSGCEVVHSREELTFTKEHNELREKINSIELKYDDIHKLWVPFLEKHQNEMINDKYIKFFKQRLTDKFSESDLNDDDLKKSIGIEIGRIHSNQRYEMNYYE